MIELNREQVQDALTLSQHPGFAILSKFCKENAGLRLNLDTPNSLVMFLERERDLGAYRVYTDFIIDFLNYINQEQARLNTHHGH